MRFNPEDLRPHRYGCSTRHRKEVTVPGPGGENVLRELREDLPKAPRWGSGTLDRRSRREGREFTSGNPEKYGLILS